MRQCALNAEALVKCLSSLSRIALSIVRRAGRNGSLARKRDVKRRELRGLERRVKVCFYCFPCFFKVVFGFLLVCVGRLGCLWGIVGFLAAKMF